MKIVVWGNMTWCMKEIYLRVSQEIGAEVRNWDLPVPHGFFNDFDYVLTEAGLGSDCLVKRHGIPRSKILLTANAEEDCTRMLRFDGNEGIAQYAGYAVVSDTLASASLAMGITRIPKVLRLGVDCNFYYSPIPKKLKVVGYAASIWRPSEYGVELKRGELARLAAQQAGLEFRPAVTETMSPTDYRPKNPIPRELMPAYYGSVDCIVTSSLQEGGSIVTLEAAAAGRLNISTPQGHAARLANEGLCILAPLDAEAFVRFTRDTLIYYKNRLNEFRDKAASIQAAARTHRDWSVVLVDWRNFVEMD
jgi:hypothetical protein